VTFLNVGYGINANAKPTGLMVQDCDAPTDYGLRSYLIWAQGTDIVVLGNKVVNSTHEHPMRVWEVERILVAYNDFANPSKYDFESMKTCFNLQASKYAYIYGNTFRGPRLQIGPLGGADGVDYKTQRTSYVVFEANQTLDTKIEVDHGAEHVMIRNNVLNAYDTTAINVEGYNADYGRGVVDLNIINNTGVNDSKNGRFLFVGGSVQGIYLVNNMYKADNLVLGAHGNGGVWAAVSSLGSFSYIANNVWPAAEVSRWIKVNANDGAAINIIGEDVSDISSYFSLSEWNAQGKVVTDYQANINLNGVFAPAGGSIAAIGGMATADSSWGVLTDYYGKARPVSGAWSIGAVEV